LTVLPGAAKVAGMRTQVPPAAAGAIALLLAACGADERATSPEGVVQRLVAAARAGDRGGVYATLGPATRARLEAVWTSSRKTTGRLALKPEDFLSVGWAPPAWDPAGMRTLRQDEASAEVEVFSAAGDRHTVQIVREAGGWKVELPGR
jgi:hypothetical protein